MKVLRVVAVGLWIAAQFLFVTVIYAQAPGIGLQVSPASIDFGEDAINADSQPHSITINNPTNATITVEQIIASGIDFSENHDCGKTLAPGAQCSVQVSFTPVISGPRTGSLEIMESNGNAHFVALNGMGK